MSRLTDLRYRLEYAGLRIVVAAVRAVPLETATAISAFLWQLIAPHQRRHSRALENLAIAYPEKTPEEREAIALAMWGNLGRVMAETMQIDRLIREPGRIRFVSPVFERYRNKMGPLIGASLHMGNWELAIWPLMVAGAKPAAIYRTVNNPYVEAYLKHQRRDLYPGGLLSKGSEDESRKTVRIITDFVRRGGRLGIVADLHDRQGLRVPFFGHPAPSTAAPALIARRTGARIWLARCLRVGTSSRFEIDMKELRVPRTANQAEDIRWVTTEIHRQFEAWVREAPEQFMWSNRRWS